jgi:hypothetical protein
MRDIVLLRIHPDMLRAVPMLFKILFYPVPRRRAYIFQKDQRGAMIRDPGHHAVESATRFSSAINGFLLVIEVRVINARCTCDEKIDISWNSG